MTEGPRDIRELAGDPDAYRAELERRWSGLLSYRYIGRNHSSMNWEPEDNTVRIRHDMRNDAGGLMVAPLAIASPEGGQSDLVAVPNPVIASVQIIDPGIGVDTIEVLGSGSIHQGRTMGYGRCLIVDADDHDRVLAFIEGQGASIGTPPEGLERMDVDEARLEIEDSPDLPPLWQVFGASERGDGHWILPRLSAEFASPDAALHIGPQHVVLETAAVDSGRGGGRLTIAPGAQLACDVRRPRQGRTLPGRSRRRTPGRAARSASACSSTTRATATAPSPRRPPCWRRWTEALPGGSRARVRPGGPGRRRRCQARAAWPQHSTGNDTSTIE